MRLPPTVKEVKARYLSEHTATHEQRGDIEIVRCFKPGTGVYWIGYWFSKGTLAVYGDCGNAVYQWHKSIGSLAEVADCNLDYFAEKCQASPFGRGFKTWNRDVAEDRLREFSASMDEPVDPELLREALESLDSEYEWNVFREEHGDEVIGSDSWEHCDIGMTVDIQCRLHLAGLKKAFEVILTEVKI